MTVHSPQNESARPFVRQAGSGSPVLCLHASTSSSRQWDAFVEQAAREYSVTASDLYGYGKSPAWSGSRKLALADEIALLEPVLSSMERPVHLIGHSFGGAVATALAVAQPDRVRSLVLYEPVLFGLLKDDPASVDAWREISDLNGAVTELVEAGRLNDACRWFIDYWSGDGFWAGLDERRQQKIRERIVKVIADFDAVLHSSPSREEIAGLKMPVLLMSGALTRLSAGRVAEIVGKLPARISNVEFSRLGHMGPVTHADTVNSMIVEYLSLVSAGGSFDYRRFTRSKVGDHKVA